MSFHDRLPERSDHAALRADHTHPHLSALSNAAQAAEANYPSRPLEGPTARILTFPTPGAVRTNAIAIPAPGHVTPEPISYQAFGKRIFDLVAVLVLAVAWMPLILVAAAMVALDGSNPFYTQERVGRNGRIFRMFKLRSMVPDAEAKLEAYLAANPDARAEWDATQKLKHDPRITRFGRLIRKTSLDELPQVLNILKGDMSLVGPRPFMVSQADLYDGEGYYRMRPGLTGLWQVSDRNECEFKGRVQFDDAYERIVSFGTDVSILIRTVSVVLRGTGY